MATRKGAFKDEENPSKRQRILGQDAGVGRARHLDTLNNDCLVSIASFLPIADLNTFALINRSFREVRNHESLDQKRKATLICSRRTTMRSLCAALNAASLALTTNYTHFEKLGLEMVVPSFRDIENVLDQITPLPNNVSILELGLNPNERSTHEGNSTSRDLLSLLELSLPNVTELVLRDAKYVSMLSERRRSQRLTRLEFTNGISYIQDGLPNTPRLLYLNLNGCSFEYQYYGLYNTTDTQYGVEGLKMLVDFEFTNDGFPGRTILLDCGAPQRLSVKGATWCLRDPYTGNRTEREPVPREMIMKMVRNLPALRWLRSDLSAENIAILQQERPEITFVSE